jgi:hypothetical protein
MSKQDCFPARDRDGPADRLRKNRHNETLEKLHPMRHHIGTPAMRTHPALGAAIAALALTVPARAVIFASTGDPNHNTSAPTGDLANSGWQYFGAWQSGGGVAISPNHFITAAHVGGQIGNTFSFGGQTYVTTGFTTVNDLRIWTVSGAMPAWAPIYTGVSESTLDAVLIGRGEGRGSEFRQPSATDSDTLRGWSWGGNSATRWGTNQIDFATTRTGYGEVLMMDFDRDGGDHEATVANGDSGGGLFVYNPDTSAWELAGVINAVASSFRLTSSGTTTQAAVFDMGGLYNANGALVAQDFSFDLPAAFFASRMSANQDWIFQSVPEPRDAMLTAGAMAAAFAMVRRARKGQNGKNLG